jgi:uncharacterized protein
VAYSGSIKRAATLPVPADGCLRLAVVADTHSAPHVDAEEGIRSLHPDAILHAGDIGDLAVLDSLAKVAPLFAVRGNIDGRAPTLPDILTLDLEWRRSVVMRILLVHIGLNASKIRANVAGMARTEGASLVVCGHSHVPFIGRDRELAVFNPGSIGPRRFSLPIVFGIIDLSPKEIRLTHIDCETGRAWSPSLV